MFFIQKISRRRRPEVLFIHWAPTLIIFLTFACVTLFAWRAAHNRAAQDQRTAISETTTNTSESITDRLDSYEAILRAAAGLINSSNNVTPAEWKSFADSIGYQQRYPSVQAIGFSQTVPNSELNQFTQHIRESGLKNFTVHPKSNNPYHVVLLYNDSRKEVIANKPTSLIGFDAYTDPIRRQAINESLATSESALSGKVEAMVQAHGQKGNSAIYIYYPVYKSAREGKDLANTVGFVQLSARPDTLFTDILQGQNQTDYGYKAYIENDSDNNLLYKSANFDSIRDSEDSLHEQKKFMLQNTEWTIEVVGKATTGTPEVQDRPEDIIIFGFLFSLFVASFVYFLLVSRTRALAYKEESEIQMAKDELLALASHQLRTPATGVKQYVGMLREGFVGDLTNQQLEVLTKAYESNERQLTTINEMLSVARADTGRLPINKHKINISELIHDVLAEQKKSFDDRLQTLHTKIPKKPIIARVDPQYFRMVIENIISNASKYTPEKGAIDVKLREEKQTIIIEVEDTGVGIPERHYALLFKKFSRIPNDLTSQVSGTGIGLYLAKYIVEAHGGSITFSSEAGVGSSFSIRIPKTRK